MRHYLYVFFGGGIGSVLRYWFSGAVYEKTGSGFPYGTLAVNVVGCFVIGLALTLLQERFLSSPSTRIFITIGILGGFTTFSSFSFETLALFRDGEALRAGMNVVLNVVICLGATWVGLQAGKVF